MAVEFSSGILCNFPSRQPAYNKTVAPPGHDPATEAEGAICSGGPGARGLRRSSDSTGEWIPGGVCNDDLCLEIPSGKR